MVRERKGRRKVGIGWLREKEGKEKEKKREKNEKSKGKELI